MKAEAEYADTYGPVLRDAIIAEAPGNSRYGTAQELGGRALKDTIYYQRSIGGERASIVVKSNAPHAKYVIHGTQPHDIFPRNAKALRWESFDGVHFSMHVHHPGTAANNFPQRGFENVRDELRAGLRAVFREAIRMEA